MNLVRKILNNKNIQNIVKICIIFIISSGSIQVCRHLVNTGIIENFLLAFLIGYYSGGIIIGLIIFYHNFYIKL